MKKYLFLIFSLICLIIAVYTYIAFFKNLPNIALFVEYWSFFAIIGSLSIFVLIGLFLGKFGRFLAMIIIVLAIICIFNNRLIPIPFVDKLIQNHQSFVLKFIAFPYSIIALFLNNMSKLIKKIKNY